MENSLVKFVGNIESGCNNFPENSYDKSWCKKIEEVLKEDMKKKDSTVKIRWKEFTENFASQFTSGLRAVKYNKELNFFLGRREDAIEAMNKFQIQCNSLYHYMFNRMVNFANSFVVLDENENYHAINRLNTHYSAVSLLMTTFINEELRRNLNSELTLKYFFDTKEKDGKTPFDSLLTKIFKGDEIGDLKFRLENTLEKTWTGGSKVESEFTKYLENKMNNVTFKIYAGEYSFVDMMGMDLIMVSPSGKFIPVQVKETPQYCVDSYSYQKNMCENWCVSSRGRSWDIKVYNGQSKIIDKLQCKTKPLNKKFFLENYSGDSENSFKETEC